MFFRKKGSKIEDKDRAIQEVKRRHTRKVNADIKAIQELNSILENGIALEIKKAIGGGHG